MTLKPAMVLLLAFTCGTAFGTERYTEARITQVDAHETGITLFLQIVSGDATPTGNGGSNEPLEKPYLVLANSPETIAARRHLLSACLVALTLGTTVRFRWEDAASVPGWITVILVRS